MSKKTHTHQELVDKSAAYFASNQDVKTLLATTHDGKFYRPENASYAAHSAEKHGGEVVTIHQLEPTGQVDTEGAQLLPASGGLAELVKSAVRVLLPESQPTDPASEAAVKSVVAETVALENALAGAQPAAGQVAAKPAAAPKKPKAAKAAPKSTGRKAATKAAE
ncbi:hypothetical protein [Hymenobacter sp. B81]|uniref:hypothetical protein n=1 Tax=Hymenobacter sp. B81 TaxID=3344878 RepID=UPI0037DDC4D5